MAFNKFISYLLFLRCILNEYSLFESLAISDKQLFFSFDKETLNNFEFNLENEKFSINSLLNQHNEGHQTFMNFINTFCLFYQYSQISYDDELKKAISTFFKSFYDENSLNNESIMTVENYLEILSERIKEVLNEKDLHHQLVLIEEKNGKIICKPNHFFKISNDNEILCDFIFTKNESHKITFDFFMRFYELDLQGFFGTDVLNSLESLNDEYFERLSDQTYKNSEKYDSKLFEIYSKMHQNLHEVNGCFLNENKTEKIILLKLFLGNCVLNCACKKYKKL